MWRCPTCGSTNEAEWETCIICGTSREQAKKAQAPRKNSVTVPVEELQEEAFRPKPPSPDEVSTEWGGFAALPPEQIPEADVGELQPPTPSPGPERLPATKAAYAPPPAPSHAESAVKILVVALALIVACLAVAVFALDLLSPATEPTDQSEESGQEEHTDSITSMVLTRTNESLSRYTRLKVTDAVASSELFYEGSWFYAGFAVDGDMATSWQEGVPGLGEQEYLTLYLDGEQTLSVIRIACGNHYSDSAFALNSRPKTLRFVFSDGTQCEWEFEDSREIVQLKLENPVRTRYVQIVLLDAYDASYQDTGISEIELYK
jgi:hypothetical protein